MDRRKTLVIISAVLFIGLVIFVIFLALNKKEAPVEEYLKDSVIITRDRDTGDLLVDDPSLTVQSDGNTGVVILGVESLVKEGFFTEELSITKNQIDIFSTTRLKGKYSTITIQPQGLTFVDGVLRTNIRLGQSDELLPIQINADAMGTIQIIIFDKDTKYGGNFDSGVITLGDA